MKLKQLNKARKRLTIILDCLTLLHRGAIIIRQYHDGDGPHPDIKQGAARWLMEYDDTTN